MASKSKMAYTPTEKLLLAELVTQQSSTIENKKTCGTTWAQKQVAWEVICAQYNAQPEIKSQRTCEQLKKLWANLKQLRRKEITREKQEMFQTGGGEIKQITTEKDLLSKIDIAAPHLDIEIDAGNWDSNANLDNNVTETRVDIQESVIEQPDISKSSAEPLQINRESSNTPENLTVRPSSSKISAQSHSKISRNYYNPKTRSIDKEKQLRLKKLQDAIQQQTELHQIKMEMARIEAECLNIKLEREKLLLQKEKSNFK